MLKPKVDKIELRLKLCQFVGYPRGTRGYYFYSQVDQKVFVHTSAIFMEYDYMMSNNVKSELDLRNLDKSSITTHNTMDPVTTIPISGTLVLHHSGRVVIQSD